MFRKSNGSSKATPNDAAAKPVPPARPTAAHRPVPEARPVLEARPVSEARPVAAGKQAYEARRAAKAGVSLERWMADKQKRAEAELEAVRRARGKAPAKRGFLKRLLDRAHKPL